MLQLVSVQKYFKMEVPQVAIKTENSCLTLMPEDNGVKLDKNGKVKVPRVRLHCSDGVYEEYSTDEEEETQDEIEKKALEQLYKTDTSSMAWLPYLMHRSKILGWRSLFACDFFGEKLAYFLGITSPKYESIIEDIKDEQEEEKKLAQEEKDAENEYVMQVLKEKRNSAAIITTNSNPKEEVDVV